MAKLQKGKTKAFIARDKEKAKRAAQAAKQKKVVRHCGPHKAV